MAGLLSIGARAVTANYLALNTVSHNIANANTEGYSLQNVSFESAGGQYSGVGFIGSGVDIGTIQRAHDEYLTREATMTASVASSDASRYEQLNQLQNLFPSGAAGLGTSITNVIGAWSDVANRANDLPSRQVVIAKINELASRITQADAQMSSMRTNIVGRLQDGVSIVNELAKKVASINDQIAGMVSRGQPPNDLLDSRDQAISQISQYVSVTRVNQDDGSVNLFIGGGDRLVLGAAASTLGFASDPFDPLQQRLSLSDGGAARLVDEATLGGGSLNGLLKFQNEDLVTARNQLGRLATVFSAQMNGQQALGLDLKGNPGNPLVATGSMRLFAAKANTSAAQPLATIADASQLQASNYELSFDGTNYTLLRQADKAVVYQGASLPQTVDGITFDLTAPANTGDRFQFQPLAQAAAGFKVLIADSAALAAASPVVSTQGATNKGTAHVESLTVNSLDPNLSQPVQITFTSVAPPTFDVVGTGTGDPTGVVLGADNTISYNGWTLQLVGQPKVGDTFSVKANTSPASNNANALKFGQMGNKQVLGNQTFSQAYSSIMADVGVRVQSAKAAADTSAAVAQNADQNVKSLAGVNLDEEAAKMLQYQQSYQAAAKILQVAQSIIDTLLQTAMGR